MPTRSFSSAFRWPRQKGKQYQFSAEYRDEDFVEIHNLDVNVTAEDQTQVASCRGTILKRPSQNFFEEADAVSQELQELSVIFCDSIGRATRVKHPKLVADDKAVRGGGFLNVESIEVKPSHAGKDLGLRILHELFCVLKTEWTLCVIVPVSLSERWCKWPENARFRRSSHTHDELSPQERQVLRRNDQKVQRHLSRMGFLQAGSSKAQEKAWFLTRDAYFGNASEKAISRWLTKEQSNNIQIHRAPEKHEPSGLDAELRNLVIRGNGATNVPVSMLMIGTVPSPTPQDPLQMVRAIEDLVRRGASIHGARAMHVAAAMDGTDPYLLQTLVRLGGNVNEPDENGNTPLHVAAAAKRARNVDYLVGSGGADPSITNRDGDTPLLTLLQSLQDAEDAQAAFGWERLAPREIDVIPAFECITALMPHSERSRLTEGWMSPRMYQVLKITAEIEMDTCVDDGMEGRTNRARYIPPDVMTQRTNKNQFRAGWGLVWRAICAVLHERCVPTVQRVKGRLESGQLGQSEWNNYQSFLQQGGKVEFAVDALLSISRNVVKHGDDGYEYETFRDDIEAHPATAFDKDFDLAWIMCITRGGGNLELRGPHHSTGVADDDYDY